MLLLFILSWLSIIQAWSTSEHDTNMYRSCPRLVHKIFTKYAPRGNFSVNIYAKQLEAHTIKACTLLCCITDGCNVAFMHKQSCYLVSTFNLSFWLFVKPSCKEEPARQRSKILLRPCHKCNAAWSFLAAKLWQRFRNNPLHLFVMQVFFTPVPHFPIKMCY